VDDEWTVGSLGGMAYGTDAEQLPRWRGINHLALITDDMDATVRFYHGVLGARLVADLAAPSFRHYFFEFGAENTVAFFEYSNVPLETFAKPAGVPDPRAVQFDHLSFNLPDEQSLLALRNRLKAADCEVTDIVDHGFLKSVYFTDPNGIALEASYWVVDPTGRPADYADEGLFADPDPVPAVVELRRDGVVATTPSTRLV
jgi:catechol 2,3-dioxygenase-like lactoylglutathione lyase family enzyme